LSVLHALVDLMPAQDFIYLADTAHCPYGPKPRAAIQARCLAIGDWLRLQGCQQLVVACNTATSAAVIEMRQRYGADNVVGMEPAIKPAAVLTQSGVIGVLATAVTVQGEKLHRLIDQHASKVRVLTQPCAGWVEMVESQSVDEGRVWEHIQPLLAAGADVLVLGCTHYPFLKPVIEKLAPQVKVIDGNAAVAKRAKALWQQKTTPDSAERGSQKGLICCYTTGDLLPFERQVRALWARPALVADVRIAAAAG
jgi:glutamate racemase